MTKPALLITAGGTSTRFGRNKLLEKINGKEVILYTIDAFKDIETSEIIISVTPELQAILAPLVQNNPKIKLVQGGATRQQSVFNGLKALSKENELVIIHDGARPIISKKVITDCIESAKAQKATIAAVKAIDTIKVVDENNKIISTPNRDTLWCVQTPQVFDYKLIFEAHKKLEGMNFSDDAGLLEYLGVPVYVVQSEYTNIKITTEADIKILENYLITD